jgi:hypothetical protein
LQGVRKLHPSVQLHQSACWHDGRAARKLVAACLIGCGVLAAPAAFAQVTPYDTSLRSIGPATVNQSSFDVRARSPIISIGASTIENRGSMVPAVYDPATGRFVSAVGAGPHGGIVVNSSNMISIIVSQQTSTYVVGTSSTGSAVPRSEAVATPSGTVTGVTVTAVPTNNGR